MKQFFISSILVGALVLAGCRGRNISGVVAAQGTGNLLEPPAGRVSGLDELAEECDTPTDRHPARTGRLDRAPYLQNASDEGATVVWTSADPQPATVEVSLPDGTAVTSVPSTVEATRYLDGSHQHFARLEPLEPATVYCYSIRQAGEEVVGSTGFRTAPEPGQDAPVRFVAFGDSGGGSEDQVRLRDQLESFDYDLLLIMGDLAYDSGELGELERKHFDVYDPMLRSIPSFPVAGNHDYHTGNAGPYLEVFHLPDNGGDEGRERWYSFDWGNVHFVGLDTERFGPEQTEWLRRDLAANDLPWVVASLHRAPFSSGYHGGSGSVQSYFLPILEAHGVQLVLAGHDHHYERFAPLDGVTHIVTGGGGKGVRLPGTGSRAEFAEGVIHAVYATVEDDEMRLHAIDATGREFDGVVIPL
ncbi:MAG: metallophosphoesterase [Myxococcota bacterium]